MNDLSGEKLGGGKVQKCISSSVNKNVDQYEQDGANQLEINKRNEILPLEFIF